jgi:hypothetical protein
VDGLVGGALYRSGSDTMEGTVDSTSNWSETEGDDEHVWSSRPTTQLEAIGMSAKILMILVAMAMAMAMTTTMNYRASN